MRLITPQDGLPDRTVLRVKQDDRGLMWFITQSGLGSYNGSEFMNYGLPGIAPEYLFRIVFDPEGNVHVNETTGSIYRLNGREFDMLEIDTELLPGGVYDFTFDTLGQMWVISTDMKRLVLLDRELQPIDTKMIWRTSDISFDRRYKKMFRSTDAGHIYVHTELKKVTVFDLQFNQLNTYDVDEIPCSFIYDIHVDDQENITLLCPPNQVVTLDRNGKIIRHVDDINFAAGRFPTLVTRSGQRLIYGRYGHSATDIELATGVRHDFEMTTEGYPSVSHTYSITESQTGNFWIGSELGILILRPRQQLFESFDLDGITSSSISGNGVRTILETENGIWFSTDRYPFYKIDTTNRKIIRHGDSTCFLFNYPSFFHGISQYNGIIHAVRNSSYDPVTGRSECTSTDPGDLIVEFDSSGRFYTLGVAGVRVYDSAGGTLLDHVETPPSILYNMFADDHGSMWICTATGLLQYQYGRGIVRAIVSDTGAVNVETVKIPGLKSGIVSDAAFNAIGQVWVATSAGLHLVDTLNQSVTLIDLLEIPNQYIYSVLPEGDSALWLGTGNGLVRYDIRSGNTLRFVAEDGIPHNEFNRRAKLAASDGWYYMGGIDGICRFRPERVLSMHQQRGAQLTLEEVSRFDGSEMITDAGATSLQSGGITLRPKDRIVSFALSLAEYMYPDLNEYSFQLEGFEPGWSDWGYARNATYYNLDPGTYQFRARARSGNKIPANNEIMIDLVVKQAFHRSTLFFLLVIAFISSVIYFIVRYRFAQKLKLERLRTRIASDLHDEVGGVLSGIAMQMDLLKHDVPDANRSRVQRVAKSSRDAASKMRDVIWSVDSSRDTFEDLEERMKAVVNELLSPIDVTWKFSSNGIQPDRYISSVVRQHIYLIFKEAVSNIAKHSGATDVAISITPIDRRGLEILLRDNGAGFDLDEVQRGDGIRNMQSRAQKISATLELSVDNGATWRLCVPRIV